MDWKPDNQLRTLLVDCVLQGYIHRETLNVAKKQFPQYSWGLRTLKRRLRYFGIKKNNVDPQDPRFLIAIQNELRGPAKLFGYRAMHQHLRLKYHLKIKRDDVYNAMKHYDPEGLKERATVGQRPKYKRRQFISKGPNWMWSVDGHDKLMGLYKHEFPLAIHGCIDSFSRKIIWLRAWPGNSSPQLPARLYFEAITCLNVLPSYVRTDKGNENGTLRQIHNFLRESHDGLTHIYGSSITNQVIERFWRDFRERHGDFFRAYVREIVKTGLYSDKDDTSRALMAILLIPILQNELNQFMRYWNSHRIRTQKIKRPCGIPNYMYEFPDDFGFVQCGLPIDRNRLEFVRNKLNYMQDMEFISSETLKTLKNLLISAKLFPITLQNLIHGYVFLFVGCKSKNIVIKLQ